MTAVLEPAAASTSGAVAQAREGRRYWRNWAGNQTCYPLRTESPRGADAIADVVTRAVADGQTVKPIGASHSFTAIGVTDGVRLDMTGHDRVLDVDKESGLVTVQSGIKLAALSDALDLHGLALTNLGDINVQSISGAISTGTHGTGLGYGGIATQVRALTLVQPDGSVLRCSPEENPDVYAVARVGLGALGVIDTVTLQTVPAFSLHAVETPSSFSELVTGHGFAELCETVDHTEFYWFPHTNGCLLKRNNRMPASESDPLPGWRAWLDDEFLSNTVFNATCTLGKRLPFVVPYISKGAAKALGARSYTDRADRVFASPRTVRFTEMEYVVPREDLEAVLTELRQGIDASGLKISFPIEVRVAAADDIALSTASGRDSAYIAVHQYKGVPFLKYFEMVEAIMRNHAGRPHWGKMNFLNAGDMARVYPRFDEFIGIRDRLDPTGVFANPYLDRVLGKAPGRA